MTSIFWTDEKIFSYIKARIDKKMPINPRAVFDDNGYVYKKAKDKFGSWNNAVIAAGFEPQKGQRKKKWTEEKIIKLIQAYYKSGSPINASFMIKKDSNLYAAAIKQYKRWNQALIAAGISLDDLKSRNSNKLNLPLSDS